MRSFLVALPVLALGAVQLLAPACVVPNVSTGEDAGSASSTSEDGGTTTTTVTATQGASCTQVSATVSLCQYISSCPNLILNTKVFPECGFRINGTAIDPECLCDGSYLCPIGSPTTCDEATADTSGDTTYDSVCEQEGEGHCTLLSSTTSGTTTTSSSGSGSSSGSSSTCQTCIQNCDNVPTCIEACGC